MDGISSAADTPSQPADRRSAKYRTALFLYAQSAGAEPEAARLTLTACARLATLLDEKESNRYIPN